MDFIVHMSIRICMLTINKVQGLWWIFVAFNVNLELSRKWGSKLLRKIMVDIEVRLSYPKFYFKVFFIFFLLRAENFILKMTLNVFKKPWNFGVLKPGFLFFFRIPENFSTEEKSKLTECHTCTKFTTFKEGKSF